MGKKTEAYKSIKNTSGGKAAFKVLSSEHPCYSEKAHGKYGRVHIPVAPKCNIACGFCDRKVSQYYHTSRPGVSSSIVKPTEAIAYVEKAIAAEPRTRVVGIAGPGDPLFNPETFKALAAVHRKWPKLQLCLCTNGLLLMQKLSALQKAGVTSLTVTVNAVDPEIGMKINRAIRWRGRTIKGIEAARILLKNQLDGIKAAVKCGFMVKVNTILIPDINFFHIEDIARKMASLGVSIMNIMPLIPCGRFKKMRRPSCDELIEAREVAEKYIPQFRACRQCRADACGVPGESPEPGKREGPGKNIIDI